MIANNREVNESSGTAECKTKNNMATRIKAMPALEQGVVTKGRTGSPSEWNARASQANTSTLN
jgi:hypothetical protein